MALEYSLPFQITLNCMCLFQMDFREFVDNGGEFDGPVQLMLEGEDRGMLEIALTYVPYCNETKTDCDRKVSFNQYLISLLPLISLLFDATIRFVSFPSH